MHASVCVCVCLRDRGRKRDGLLSKTKTSHYIWLPQSWEGTEGTLCRSVFVSFASLFFFFLPEGESISATFREEMPGDKILTMSDNCYSSIIFSITAVMLTSVPPNHEQRELMVLGDTLDFSSWREQVTFSKVSPCMLSWAPILQDALWRKVFCGPVCLENAVSYIPTSEIPNSQ